MNQGADRLDPVERAFFDRPVVSLARAMIGKVLVHRSPEGLAAGRIVETEAYRGPEDLAAHSAGGRRTKRTEVMFGPAGFTYMFLLYGSSWAFNVIAGARDVPHAVLVRALEPWLGLELMAERRKMPASRRELTNGPGKLSQAMGLDGNHYGRPLGGPDLYLAEGRRSAVKSSPRINIDYAGAWVQKPYRFYERGNRYVSVRPRD